MNKKLTFISIMILAVMMLISAVSVLAADTDDITFESVEVGYNDEFLFDHEIPIYVEVKNNTDRNISGTLTVLIQDDGNQWYTYSSADTIEISTDVTLAPGVSKKISFPINEDFDNCYADISVNVTFTDKDGKILGSSEKNYSGPNTVKLSGYSGINVGVIAEEAGSQCFKNMQGASDEAYALLFSGLYLNIQELTPEHFPKDYKMISEFSILLVDDIDFSESSSYSKEQIELINTYIKCGGIVVLSGGNVHSNTIRGFQNYFAGSFSKIATQTKTSIYLNEFSYFQRDYDVKESREKKGVSLVSFTDDNFTLLKKDKNENGLLYKHKDHNLFVMGFSLSDGNFFSDGLSAQEFFDILFEADSIFEEAAYQEYYDYGNVTHLINGTTPVNDFKGGILLGILALYVILFILGSFILLKIIKKEKLLWICIPAAALLASIFICVYGVVEKGVNNTVNTIVFSELSSADIAKSRSFTSVTCFTSGNHKTAVNKDGVCYTTATDWYYDSDDTGLNLYYGNENYSSSVYKGLWHSSNLYATYTDTSLGHFEITGIYMQNDGKYSITVKNCTGKDLEDAYLFALGQTVLIGDFMNGDEFTAKDVEYTTTTIPDETELLYQFYYRENGLTYIEAANDKNSIKYYNKDSSSIYDSLIDKLLGYDTDSVMLQDKNTVKSMFELCISTEIASAKLAFKSTPCLFVSGIDRNADSNITVDGKKAEREAASNVMYQIFELSGDVQTQKQVVDSQMILTETFIEDDKQYKFVYYTDTNSKFVDVDFAQDKYMFAAYAVPVTDGADGMLNLNIEKDYHSSEYTVSYYLYNGLSCTLVQPYAQEETYASFFLNTDYIFYTKGYYYNGEWICNFTHEDSGYHYATARVDASQMKCDSFYLIIACYEKNEESGNNSPEVPVYNPLKAEFTNVLSR